MVIVDSSVLIHLSRIGKLSLLKKFFGKIKITQDIYNEIKVGKIISEFEEGLKNRILIYKPKNFDKVNKLSKLEDIEKADASIILLAKEKHEILLSNDYVLMMVARSMGVACWWLTTFLLDCLKKKITTKKQAKQILFDLVGAGMKLKNEVYAGILKEIEDM